MDIVLDTNAFYNYLGSEKLDLPVNPKVNRIRLNNLLSSGDYKIFLTAHTIYEIVMKFSNDLSKLRECISFMEHIQVNLFYKMNQYFNKDIFWELLSCNDKELAHIVKKIIRDKIRIEAKHTVYFLFSLTSCFLFLYCCDKDYHEDSYDIPMAFMDDHLKSIVHRFRSIYYQGYKEDNIENMIKHSFNEVLGIQTRLFCSLAEYVEQCINDNKDIYVTKFVNDYLEKHRKMLIQSNECERISKFYNKAMKNKAKYDWYDFTCLPREKHEGMSRVVSDYYNYLLKKWGVNGSKFRKNDIFDMLNLSIGEYPAVLITFDEEVIKFLRSINHLSCQFIDKIYKS